MACDLLPIYHSIDSWEFMGTSPERDPADALTCGRAFRLPDVVDYFTHERLAPEVTVSLPSARSVRVLERLVELCGKPESIAVDN